MSRDKQIRLATLNRGLIAFLQLLIFGLSPPTNASEEQGELGGDFRLLHSSLTAAKLPGQSNYFIDMWSGGQMVDFARDPRG